MPAARSRLPAVAMVTSLLAGCAGYQHIPMDPEDAGQPQQARLPAPDFRLTGPPPTPDGDDVVEPRPPPSDEWRRRMSAWLSDNLRAKDLDGYEVERFWFPSAGENGQPDERLVVRYYRSTRPGRHPLVIVLPIYGSYMYPPEKIAWRLREESDGGLHIMMILAGERNIDWEGIAGAEDLEELDAAAGASAEMLRVAVVDTRRLVGWAVEQPEVDADRIALVGFSMGALVASAVLTNEPRVSHAVLVMGAARPGQILATCPGKAAEARDEAMARFSWTQQEYAAYMGRIFRILDPARYAGRIDPRRVLMFDASADDCMPPSSREALWEALGRPERYTLKGTHKGAFLTMTPLKFDFTTDRIWEFVEEELLGPTRSPVKATR